jgi:predicted RNase H-like HicB family nuclease
VQEHFTPAPALYDDAYSFFGVHRQFEDLHEVYVPDVPCAIGAGATFEEAMDEVVVKLSCQLLQMREEGLEVPKASSAQEVEERGRKGHVEAASGYGPPVALRVVTVHSDFLKVPTPSDAELEQLTRVASDMWRSIQASAPVALCGDPIIDLKTGFLFLEGATGGCARQSSGGCSRSL